MTGAGVAGPIRVVIADDAFVIREGLAATLSREPDIELGTDIFSAGALDVRQDLAEARRIPHALR